MKFYNLKVRICHYDEWNKIGITEKWRKIIQVGARDFVSSFSPKIGLT
jgi:hypothetical protein